MRVLAATNKNPEQAVAAGQLRGDLYYRLNVFNIHMPPLREHKEDIPAITEAMLRDMNLKHERRVTGDRRRNAVAADRLRLAGQCQGTAQHHRARGDSLRRGLPERPRSAARLRQPLRTAPSPSRSANAIQVEVGTTVDEAERRLILKTLESTQNNKTRAAEILGISLKTMHNKLKEYGAASAPAARAAVTSPKNDSGITAYAKADLVRCRWCIPFARKKPPAMLPSV